MRTAIDPITFEVVKNGFDSIADQMAITLMRSAYSAIVRDSVDYSTGFCDGQGRMLAQGLTTPLHLGSFPPAMRKAAASACAIGSPPPATTGSPCRSGRSRIPTAT